jgi:hypothetical protein
MNANRRGTLVVYGILALAIFSIIFSGAVAPPIGALMLFLFFGFVWLTALPMPKVRLPKRPARKPVVTRAAQQATERKPQQTSLFHQGYLLQDIGLVVDERRNNGLFLRRARLLSLDDESIRPYTVIHYPEDQYPMQTVVRFEIRDAAGQPQFVCETEYYFRPGENLILPDYRLRLKDNSRLSRTGTWDITASVDGYVLGVHYFSLAPSVNDRLRSGPDGEIRNRERLVIEQEEALPLSLEELLRSQRRS